MTGDFVLLSVTFRLLEPMGEDPVRLDSVLLLDVAQSGENVVEREGISFQHPAKFILVGTMNPEDDTIFLKVQITDKDGQARNIYFPFDIFNDTATEVALEMVKELEITDWEPLEIAEMIEQEISSLVPNWKECGSPQFCHQHSFSYEDEDDDKAAGAYGHAWPGGTRCPAHGRRLPARDSHPAGCWRAAFHDGAYGAVRIHLRARR